MITFADISLSDSGFIACVIAAVIASVMCGYVFYVVAKIKHENKVIDEANAAKVAGEEYPEYRIQQSTVWFTGYSYALVALVICALVAGVFFGMVGCCKLHITGEVMIGVATFAVTIICAVFIDYFIIHPIAKNKGLEMETELVNAAFQAADDAADKVTEGDDKDLQVIAQIYKLIKGKQ